MKNNDKNEFKKLLLTKDYDFLRNNEHLGKNIILLTLGGSYAYGTNKTDGSSDVDCRGIAVNCKKEILLGNDFEQVVDEDTDSTVYSFNKMIDLLTKQNPNTIEQLGCLPEHYLYLSDIGRELLENRKMFLSKICIHTFGGYASAQARRAANKSARLVSQAENEAYILKSIQNAEYDFKNRYSPYNDGAIKLYVDKAIQEGYDTEIFMDVNLKHYPLRDYTGLWNEMKSIVSSYNKFGRRNEKAVQKDKMGKHLMHLIRLYIMCIDILEKEEIITYRTDEHDLLMKIRNGEFLDENRQPTSDFYDILNDYEKRFEYAKNNTSLPDVPDYKKIEEFKMSVNERIILGKI